MNFKPFYINIQDMTDEQVCEILNKSIAAGAVLREDVSASCGYRYFGVDYDSETIFWDKTTPYSNECTIAIEITLDQVDEHLGLTKPKQTTTTQENIMTNEITDLRNTAIKLEGMRNEDIQAYLDACELQGSLVTVPILGANREGYMEYCDGGVGFNVYRVYEELETSTQLINFTSKTTWTATPVVEREVVTLFGTDYYADMIQPLLDTLEAAKVGGVSTQGTGTPPDRPNTVM